jgi:hypothetical protein
VGLSSAKIASHTGKRGGQVRLLRNEACVDITDIGDRSTPVGASVAVVDTRCTREKRLKHTRGRMHMWVTVMIQLHTRWIRIEWASRCRVLGRQCSGCGAGRHHCPFRFFN